MAPSDLTSEVHTYVDRLCQADVVIRRTYALTQDFAAMLWPSELETQAA
jgi:hypothetical protein